MSEFVRLGDHIVIAKGKPPAELPFEGPGACVYLTPEYLRGRGAAPSARPGIDAVIVADGDAVLLWDGSNAGEIFRGRAGFAASTMARLRADESIQHGYLVHVLKHLEPRLKSQTNGTGIPHVDREVLEGFKIFCPFRLEQTQISDVLDTLDTTIRQTEAIIEKLKQVKQGLLHDLLTRGIDANGELRPSQSQAPHLYKESPLGWIPREWKIDALGELAIVDRGKFTHRPRNAPAFYGGRYPFIQTGDVADAAGGYISTYSQTLSERGIAVSQEFPVGTIAITIAANIADTAILAVPMYFPDSVVGAVVAPEINNRFIELTIRRAKPRLSARAPQSAQKNINLEDLRPMLVALPSKEEQDAVADLYEVLHHQLDHERIAAAKTREIKSGLMDDLLTGRVRVTPLLT